MTNLRIRVLVAAIGIPLVILVTLAGGFAFYCFVAGVALLCLREFFDLAEAAGAHPIRTLAYAGGAAIPAIFLHGRIQSSLIGLLAPLGIHPPWPTMTQSLLILMLIAIPFVILKELFRSKGSSVLNIAVEVFGIAYIPFFLGSLVGLRELFTSAEFPVYRHFVDVGLTVPPAVEERLYLWGGLTILALFGSVWLCDSAAFFAGRYIGRRKLFPRISPNKTWEGAIAGFLSAVAAFVLFRWVFGLDYLTVLDAVVCGSVVGVFGQLGDLAESMLKRGAGVKDSSSVIPGHGGFLDRFDSIIMVSPLVFFYIDFVVCT